VQVAVPSRAVICTLCLRGWLRCTTGRHRGLLPRTGVIRDSSDRRAVQRTGVVSTRRKNQKRTRIRPKRPGPGTRRLSVAAGRPSSSCQSRSGRAGRVAPARGGPRTRLPGRLFCLPGRVGGLGRRVALRGGSVPTRDGVIRSCPVPYSVGSTRWRPPGTGTAAAAINTIGGPFLPIEGGRDTSLRIVFGFRIQCGAGFAPGAGREHRRRERIGGGSGSAANA